LVNREGNLRLPDEWLRPDGVAAEIVAVQRDVERAGRDLVMCDLVNRLRDPARQRHAARADADKRKSGKTAGTAVAFEDFVRDSREAAGHSVRIEDNGHVHLFAASLGRVKEHDEYNKRAGRAGRAG